MVFGLKIEDLQGVSTVDYPEKIVAGLFKGGGNIER